MSWSAHRHSVHIESRHAALGVGPVRDFAEIRAAVAALPGADGAHERTAREREAVLTKPAGSLGRLEDIAAWVAAWQGRHPPRAQTIKVLVFAANHGVTQRGVSAYPAAVTAQMVANFAAGGAAVNQLARSVGADLEVHPIELDRPTADFTQHPAMSEAECVAAMAFGMDRVAHAAAPRDRVDLLCLGEMGIGNTTAAAALCFALFGGSPDQWVGRGTGVDEAGLGRKVAAVAAAAARHGATFGDPLAALSRVGGREFAAIAGAVLAARLRRIPVLLDGYVATAAAAPLAALNPRALDHCLAAHLSAESGHRVLLEKLGMAPLLDLGMRLGEASGAVLAAAIVKAAVAVHCGMATFDEAGVSGTSA